MHPTPATQRLVFGVSSVAGNDPKRSFAPSRSGGAILHSINPVIRIATALAMLFCVSCDAYHWPPYENQLRAMFLESKSVLVEIESEMISDDIFLAGRDRQRQWSNQSEITVVQLSKYAELFDRLPYHWSVARNDGITFIHVDTRPIRGTRKSFTYSITHRESPSSPPSCDIAKRELDCGGCSVDLGDQWSIEYLWQPTDIGPEWDGSIGEGKPTEEDIQQAREAELIECFNDGHQQTGQVIPD